MGDRKKDKEKKNQAQQTQSAPAEPARADVQAEPVEAPGDPLGRAEQPEDQPAAEAVEAAETETAADQPAAEQAEEVRETEAAEYDQALAEADDRFRRLAAEYENFRRRSQEEKNRLYEQSVADVVTAFLPVLDNIERALAASEALDADNEQAASVRTGVEMIYRQMLEVLEKQGVEEIQALGEGFDPNLHAAVLHEESPDHGHQEITEVFEKGWRRGDKVLRHSVVKVAN